MQSVSSRIWTRVTVPISYDDYHYTTVLIDQLRCIHVREFALGNIAFDFSLVL